ncbi:transposase, partial [Streptomyces sedi]|uniref:transposase n=1 Tax=Streptomyces sedi TaxID=555059 RepID=UPI003CD0719D
MYWYFTRWHDDGTVEKIHDALRDKVRRADGRDPAPTAGVIDSQSVRAADSVPQATSGYDAGKRQRGRKRFIVTDTLGLLLAIHVVSASVQDRDGARHFRLDHRADQMKMPAMWSPA